MTNTDEQSRSLAQQRLPSECVMLRHGLVDMRDLIVACAVRDIINYLCICCRDMYGCLVVSRVSVQWQGLV